MITTSTSLALAYGIQSLTLTNSLVSLLKNARKNGKDRGLGIAEIVHKLPGEAMALNEEFKKQITDMKIKFIKEGIDLKTNIDDLDCNYTWWNSRQDKLMIKFQTDVTAITAQLSNFMDDIVAVARCSGEEELLCVSYEEAKKSKKKLRRDTDFEKHTIGDIFDNLIKHTDDLTVLLGDMNKT